MELIHKYFPNISEKQVSRIQALPALYKDWNQKINVVSRKDVDELMLRHVLHSMAIARVVSFKDGTEILDMGTGGGFPGIPLAILFPQCRFHLVDSIGKKIRVVDDVAAALELDNVTTYNQRVEELNLQVDFVASRAVAPIRTTKHWTRELIRTGTDQTLANGWLLLKGGDLKKELSEVSNQSSVYDLGDIFDEAYFSGKSLVHVAA